MSSTPDVTSKQDGNNLIFYVWDPRDAGGPGHVGVGYSQESGDKGYHAVWPKGSVVGSFAASLFGFMFGIPSRSEVVQSLAEDISNEGRQPDRIISVPASPEAIKSAQNYFNRRKTESDAGLHAYCLSPNLPWGFKAVQMLVSSFPGEPTSDQEIALARGDKLPADEDDKVLDESLKALKLGHCATEGRKLANIIAEHNKESPLSLNRHLPYGYTPRDIGDIAEGFKGARVERPVQNESWEDKCGDNGNN